MNPGQLDQRIEILSPTIVTSADSGGAQENWTMTATVWGQRADQGGREYRSNGALHAEAASVFTIRYRPTLSTRDRLRCDGKDYDILSIGETGPRRSLLLIQAKVRLP